MNIILATHNKNKVVELQRVLSDIFSDVMVMTATEAGFTDDIEENGSTFEENAMIKARAVKKEGYISVADDSGLCVNALDGAPGIYSARYSGEPKSDERNNALLLANLEGKNDRSAYFVSAIACVMPNGEEFTVRGTAEGYMLSEQKGQGGFGYDPLFYFPPLDKTFAELTTDEKNQVSHRGNAIRAFAKELSKRLS